MARAQNLGHRLSLNVTTPKVVTEGEAFKIGYRVKNIGSASFPGGRVIVEISWASLDQKVIQPINITNPIIPNAEMEENNYSQAPLMAGYTWFSVVGAEASDGNPVEIYNTGGALLWPYPQAGSGSTAQIFKQPVFAVRARTHDEIISRRALWLAAGSLVVLVAFQIADWVLRFYSNK